MIQATGDLADHADLVLRDLLLGTPELTDETIPGTDVTVDELFDLSDYLNIGPCLNEYLEPIRALGGRDDFSIGRSPGVPSGELAGWSARRRGLTAGR